MTGYGKRESTINGVSCQIEIRSVNGRFLDVSCRLPRHLTGLENAIRTSIRTRLARGSVTCSVNLGAGERETVPVSYSEPLIREYVRLAQEIQQKFGLAGEVRLENVLALPELFSYSDSATNAGDLEAHILSEIDKTLDAVVEMRLHEGANLALDLRTRVHKIEGILERIAILDPARIQYWRDRFSERIKILMGEAELDPVRVVQEASIIADRLDITEEITRFKSHDKLFIAALDESANQGKKMNFILQEMAREANTLGTKCQSAEIASLAILLKDEVETIREQVQNIE